MQMPGYPPGVPNPLVRHVHPYPTRFHGTIYTRPVFGLPYVLSPGNVAMPGEIAGLGDYNVGQGVFRPGGYGGGVFDGNLAGLGATDPVAAAQTNLTQLQATISALASQMASVTPNQAALLAEQIAALQKQETALKAEIKKLQSVPKVPVSFSPPVAAPPVQTAPVESLMVPSDNKWVMFVVGGGIAIGALIYLKKKKKI
jgi:hypothetical protein